MRLGNARIKSGDSRRMYPARQTRSTCACLSAATTSASCSSRTRPLEGINCAFSPRRRADSSPEHPRGWRSLQRFPPAGGRHGSNPQWLQSWSRVRKAESQVFSMGAHLFVSSPTALQEQPGALSSTLLSRPFRHLASTPISARNAFVKTLRVAGSSNCRRAESH